MKGMRSADRLYLSVGFLGSYVFPDFSQPGNTFLFVCGLMTAFLIGGLGVEENRMPRSYCTFFSFLWGFAEGKLCRSKLATSVEVEQQT